MAMMRLEATRGEVPFTWVAKVTVSADTEQKDQEE